MKRLIAAGIAVNTALLQTAAPLTMPARPPLFRAADHGWLDLSIIKQAQAEIPSPMRYVGIIGGHAEAGYNDKHLDDYLAGKLWCGMPCPGDMVELVGEFVTARTFTLQGTASAPFIFKSLAPSSYVKPWPTSYTAASAKINGLWTINGKWLVFHGFKFCKKASQPTLTHGNRGCVKFGGDDNILRRCEFTEWDANAAILPTAGNRGIIDYCEWHDQMDWTDNDIAISDPALRSTAGYGQPGGPVTLLRMGTLWHPNFSNGTTFAQRFAELKALSPMNLRFRRNYGHDLLKKSWPEVYASAQTDFFEFGLEIELLITATKDAANQWIVGGQIDISDGSWRPGLECEYILIERHHEFEGPPRKPGLTNVAGGSCFDIKCPFTSYKKIAIRDSPGTFDFRNGGPYNVAEDVYFENGGGMFMSGYGHSINRVKAVGKLTNYPLNHGLGFVAPSAGDLYPWERVHDAHHATQDCLVKNADCTVRGSGGGQAGWHLARHPIIRNCNQAKINIGAGDATNIDNDGSGNPVAPYITVGPDQATATSPCDVGITAPWRSGEV